MISAVDHQSRAHSTLSASSTERWWNCPASVRASEGLPDTKSEYAEEGTAAHELGNICLDSGQDALEYTDRVVHGYMMTEEDFTRHVQVYLDECRQYIGPGWQHWVERKFSLEALNPPCPMFGTSDFTAFHAESGLLVVVDYKHGQGIAKEAKGNPQLMYYALGCICSLPADTGIQRVRTTIVQPRLFGSPPVKTHEFSVIKLAQWSSELLDHAWATIAEDAPFHAGYWCRDTFCRVSPCKAQAAAACEIAAIEFDDLCEPSTEITAAPVSPLNVDLLTPEQIGQALDRVKILEDFVKALKDKARFYLECGTPIGSWMIAQTESRAKWTEEDDATVIETLDLLFDELNAKEVAKMSVRSPAEVREILTKKLRELRSMKAKDAKALAVDMLKDLITHKSGGTKLVPFSDKHKPALTAADDFAEDFIDHLAPA